MSGADKGQASERNQVAEVSRGVVEGCLWRFWGVRVVIHTAPEFVEETPAEDGEAWMVVLLFGDVGTDLLEELCEKSRDVASGGSRPGPGARAKGE